MGVQDFNNGGIMLADENGSPVDDSTISADNCRAIVSPNSWGNLEKIGNTYKGVATTLAEVHAQLTTALQTIKDHWHGDAADSAQDHISRIHTSSDNLASSSGDTSHAILAMQQAVKTSQSTPITDDNAVAVWTRFKNDTNTALGLLPGSLSTDIPGGGNDTSYNPGPPGPGVGPGAPGVGPGVGPGHIGPGISPGPGVGPGTGPGIGHGPGGPGPIGPGGIGPGHVGPGIGPGGIGPGTGIDAGSSLAGAGGGPGVGPGGAGGAGLGSGGGPGAGGGLGSSGGLAGGAAGGGGTSYGVAGVPDGAGGAAGAGRGMMPMTGGQGNDEQERERSTWLTEDEDVWGGSDAPPPTITG